MVLLRWCECGLTVAGVDVQEAAVAPPVLLGEKEATAAVWVAGLVTDALIASAVLVGM